MARQLIPLAILFVIVAAILVVKETMQEEVSIEQQVQAVDLAPEGFRVADVTRLAIDRSAERGEEVVLVRADGGWVIDSLYDAPAATETVEAFLENFKGLEGELRSSSQDVLPDYGLGDDQALRFKVYTGGEEPALELLVGKVAREDTFVRRAGSPEVYRLLETVDFRARIGMRGEDESPDPAHWLDRTFVDIASDSATALELTWPDKVLAFEKRPEPVEDEEAEDEEGEDDDADEAEGDNADEADKDAEPELVWTLTRGGYGENPAQTVRVTAIEDMLYDLANTLRAETAVDPATPAEWGLANPGYRLRIARGEADPIVLLGGRPDPDGPGFVRMEGGETIYRLDATNFEKLFPAGARFFDIDAYDEAPKAGAIDAVIVKGAAVPMEFRRGDDGWSVMAPDKQLRLKPDAMRKLTRRLATWRPGDYADGPPEARGLAEPDDAVTFRHGEEGALVTLNLGDESPVTGGRYVRVGGEGPIVTMKPDDVRVAHPEPMTLFDDAFLDVRADEIEAIELRGVEPGFKLAREDGLWYLASGDATVAADGGAAQQLANRIALLRADGLMSPEPIEDGVTVTVERQEAEAIAMTFDPETGRVKLPERDVDFKVSPQSLKLLVVKPEVLRATAGE